MTKRFLISKDSKFFVGQVTLLLALLTSLSPFATDTYMPALPAMAKDFGQPINLFEITLTIYFIGVAVGQLFGGPLSESFGRKKIALSGMLLFATSSLLAIFAPNVEVLWMLRFLQAIGGGAASVVNMAFVRDWFEGRDVARLSSLIGMIMMIAPLIAPVIGTLLLVNLGWESIFFFMFLVSITAFISFLFFMPESREASLISNKITFNQFFGSYKKVFSSWKIVLMILSLSFAVAGMFTFLTGASFLYIDYFEVDVNHFPLFFSANVILNVLLTFLNYRLVKHVEPIKILQVGLSMQFLAGVMLVFMASRSNPGLWPVFVSIVLYVGSLGLIFANGVSIIINHFPQISGSANAVIGVVRFAFSGVIGSLVAVFHTGTIIPMAIVMLACTVIASVLFFVSKRIPLGGQLSGV
ncbi:MAG: Bcr/CflA family multidrug efflux MFS transporter [Prolixibacteraceae bacterium]|jgi:DHA1 family bicyclomycin/chloramphenicol resistance-like MFS transporter|nr:Bcr/CflA family multidrug efflux MFS transporter [Prolixibacteraceae bacterium]